MTYDVILVDIIKEVCNSMQVLDPDEVPYNIHYQPGRNIDIINELINRDSSSTYKDKKYPLIAMVLPVRENRGDGYYATVIIDRIVIATLTSLGIPILKKYDATETFKTVLYPCYNEFLKRLTQHKNVMNREVQFLKHTKWDNPAHQPISETMSDYVDIIEIRNLEIKLVQNKTC